MGMHWMLVTVKRNDFFNITTIENKKKISKVNNISKVLYKKKRIKFRSSNLGTKIEIFLVLSPKYTRQIQIALKYQSLNDKKKLKFIILILSSCLYYCLSNI